MENEKETCSNCKSSDIEGSLSPDGVFMNGSPILILYRNHEISMKRCKDCGLLWGHTKVE